MSKNNIIKRAFLNALGVVAYVSLFAWCINILNKLSGGKPDGPLSPVLFLTVFIISASITGSLVLLKPFTLYHEGQKKEGLHMFIFTVVFLIVLAVVVGFLNTTYQVQDSQTITPSPNPVPIVEKRCGGNMQNAPSCGPGFHCAPVPGSHLPFGDVGGLCVPD